MENLAWPPVLIHWSMKTVMSLPVTVKMALANEWVLITMLAQEEGLLVAWAAVAARESCLFNTWVNIIITVAVSTERLERLDT